MARAARKPMSPAAWLADALERKLALQAAVRRLRTTLGQLDTARSNAKRVRLAVRAVKQLARMVDLELRRRAR